MRKTITEVLFWTKYDTKLFQLFGDTDNTIFLAKGFIWKLLLKYTILALKLSGEFINFLLYISQTYIPISRPHYIHGKAWHVLNVELHGIKNPLLVLPWVRRNLSSVLKSLRPLGIGES